MSNSQMGENCQMTDSVNSFPSAIESLRFPLDNSMRIIFTGYFNGYSVEVRSVDEMALVYHMGCFGKGSASRSKPKITNNDCSPNIMRKRQFLKRNYWYKKFGGSKEISELDLFLKEVESLTAKVVSDGEKLLNKEVIDLVSSDDENSEDNDYNDDTSNVYTNQSSSNQDIAIVVPNSDSEEDNYFANLKPKCCVNKIRIQEKLMLSLQEAFFLTYGLGCLQVINNGLLNTEQCWDLFRQTDKNFVSRYVVYHYFRSKGYVVKPGIKFGGDYLLYKEGPEISHADYIVIIRKEGEARNWTSIICQIRMATTTAKEVIIAEIINLNQSGQQETLEALSKYEVREILVTRRIPVEVNEDDE